MSHDIDSVCKSDFRRENYETDAFVLFESQPKAKLSQVANKPPVLYVPEGFEPEQFLAPNRRRCGDRARYLLHTIHTQSIFNSRKRQDGVHLKAEYLRNFMGKENYRGVITDLEEGGVIEVKRVARDGVSNRFRFTTGFQNRICRRCYPQDGYLIRKLLDRRADDDRALTCPTRRHLREQLSRVRIDAGRARKVLDNLPMSLDAKAANASCLERLVDQEWFFKQDRFGRVHHNITCLKRELRACLRVDGSPLVELDISNSQPLFCGLAFFIWKKNQKSFAQLWSNDAFADALLLKEENLEQLIQLRKHKNKYNQTNQITLPLPCPGFGDVNNDSLVYLVLCEQGRFYEQLASAAKIDISDQKRRSQFKEQVFEQLLFAKWRGKDNLVVKAFKEKFPSILEMIRKVNYKDHTRLAKWMQKVESSLVIDGVVERFRLSDPEAFVLTIHDSILVKQKDAETIRGCFQREFGRFGVVPSLNVK